MKFKIRQNELVDALKIVADSKALGKKEDDVVSGLLIKAKDNELEFMTTNMEAWVSSKVTVDHFEDSVDDIAKFFNIEQEGEIFVDVFEFIKVMPTFNKNIVIEFEKVDKEQQDENNTYLQVKSTSGRKKDKYEFIECTPTMFQESPPDEERKTIEVYTEDLKHKVNSVAFASGTDERETHLWGVQVEVYGEGKESEIATCATDRDRICYYDSRGHARKITKEENGEEVPLGIILWPQKVSFVAALSCLDSSEEFVTIETGERRTILRQKNQWHAFSNVIFGSERMPDWRSIAESISSQERSSFCLPKSTFLDVLKTAALGSGGKYGIKIQFDSEAKETVFSVQQVQSSGKIKSNYTSTVPADKVKGEAKTSVVLAIEDLKDILEKSKGEEITVSILTNQDPVVIWNEQDKFRYISSVIVD